MKDFLITMILTAAYILLPFFIVLLLYFLYKNSQFKKTVYYQLMNRSYWTTRTNAGYYGEYLVSEYLKRLGGDRRFLFNIYLPRDNGETTEIDVLLIHETGLYVFESKNYSGWIYGSEYQRQWTQTLKNGIKNHFFNPIMQNELHIKWLKNLLSDMPNIPYFSYIVFSDRCVLKNITLTSDKAEVINRYSILNRVLYNAPLEGPSLTGVQIQSIYCRLYPYSKVSYDTMQKHIKDINTRINSPYTPPASVQPMSQSFVQSIVPNGICPRCGQPLVLRTTQRGENKGKQFWGCSGFPKCRYLKNIDDQIMQ